jgi:hypothetical protein
MQSTGTGRAWRPRGDKAGVPGLLHKSDAGAVKLDLSGAGDVRRACEELAGKSAARLTGVLVQPMGSGGTGVIIGVAREPVSGPVMHGPGGVAARVLSGHSAGLVIAAWTVGKISSRRWRPVIRRTLATPGVGAASRMYPPSSPARRPVPTSAARPLASA